MEVLVTGGSGFVGSHVIEGLVARGATVRALARSDASARKVEGFGARAVRGELGAIPDEAARGCEAVVHAAAFVEEWGTRAQFFEANVEGTRQALEVARRAGVRRFVHIGTEAALFDGHDLVDIDESHPYPARHRYLYSESKAEAEKLVLAASASRFAALSLRPRLVWGPRDASVLPAVLRMAREGSFAWLDGGRARTSSTHVANLVRGVELALERGEGGRAYFLGDGEDRTLRELLDALAATQGVTLPERSLPGALARPLASLVEGAYRLAGAKRAPPMTRFAIAMMSRTVTVRTARAERELGWSPVVRFADGLATMRAA